MEYLRWPEDIAALITLQPQLHRVRGRRASSESQQEEPLPANLPGKRQRETSPQPPAERHTPQSKTTPPRSRCALGCKRFFDVIQNNIPIQLGRRTLNQGKHRLGPPVPDVGAACTEDAAQLLAEPACRLIQLEDGSIISVRNGMDGKFRLLDSPTLLARDKIGKNHIFFRMVDIEAKKLFLVSADVVSREDFNNIAKRTEIDALHTMAE